MSSTKDALVKRVFGHRYSYEGVPQFFTQYVGSYMMHWVPVYDFVGYDDQDEEPIYTQAFYDYVEKHKELSLKKITPTRKELEEYYSRG